MLIDKKINPQQTLVYTFEGIFNFFHEPAHINNIKLQPQNTIMINFEKIY